MESLPPELLSYIAHFVPSGSYSRFLRTSRPFYTAGAPFIYDKRTQYLESQDIDQITDAINSNDLGYFQYLLNRGYSVSWGNLRRIILFNRKDFVRAYTFTVDTPKRIADILSILSYTGDPEMMEILKPRLKNIEGSVFYSLPDDSGPDLVQRIFNVQRLNTFPYAAEYIQLLISRLDFDKLKDVQRFQDVEIGYILDTDDPFLFDLLMTKNPTSDDIIAALVHTAVLTPQIASFIHLNWPDIFEKIGPNYAIWATAKFESMLKSGWRPKPETIQRIVNILQMENPNAWPGQEQRDLHVISILKRYNLISDEQYQELINNL